MRSNGLAAGENLALVGSELIQFGEVTALGNGRFRLRHLLRGRAGTEWASATHSAGELFCLIRSDSLQTQIVPAWVVGAVVSAEAASGQTSVTFGGQSLRPPSPVNVSALLQPNGDLVLNWTRRSRAGFAWVDEIDAPLGEMREEYRVDVTGSAASLELSADEPAVTVAAAELATLGAGAATIEVRQIGDLAVSAPAQLSIILS